LLKAVPLLFSFKRRLTSFILLLFALNLLPTSSLLLLTPLKPELFALKQRLTSFVLLLFTLKQLPTSLLSLLTSFILLLFASKLHSNSFIQMLIKSTLPLVDMVSPSFPANAFLLLVLQHFRTKVYLRMYIAQHGALFASANTATYI
jgi:hypothetical protein